MSRERGVNPPNRFGQSAVVWDEVPPPPARLEVVADDARSILSRSASPGLPAAWGLNPYRGCTHACTYCFARTYHEHLGLSVGEDFERRLRAKYDAPALLVDALERSAWQGEPIVVSQITDPYQPIERRLEITRRCLEILARYRNPTVIITRAPLVARDVELLAALAAHDAVRVNVSLPVGDAALCRVLEPGTAPPSARLAAVSVLAGAGVPVGVSLSPMIPGVGEALIPQTLEQAAAAGAQWAWMGLLRLPPGVDAYFEARLREGLPGQADGILRRLRAARGGALDGARGGGEGPHWALAQQLFSQWRRRLGLGEVPPFPAVSPLWRPGQGQQQRLW